jgi:hypothetical protein
MLRDLVLNKAHDHMVLLDDVSSSRDPQELRVCVQQQVSLHLPCPHALHKISAYWVIGG